MGTKRDTVGNREGFRHRMEEFCHTYVANGFMGRRAAIACGYSEANAGNAASEILKLPEAQRLIEKIKRDHFARLHMGKAELLGRIATMARSDPSACFDDAGKLLPLAKIDPEVRACIVEYDPAKNTVRLEPRAPALNMLGKHHKLLGDQIDVTTKGEAIAPEKVDDVELAKRIAFLLTTAASKATA